MVMFRRSQRVQITKDRDICRLITEMFVSWLKASTAVTLMRYCSCIPRTAIALILATENRPQENTAAAQRKNDEDCTARSVDPPKPPEDPCRHIVALI